MKKSIFVLQFSGFVFVSVLGTLLHFAFDWSRQNIIIGIFSAVNESIWEHIKLLYFPQIIFIFIEKHYLKPLPKNFWYAKAIGILIGIITIPTLYYTYSGILGVNVDWFNILIFFITSALVFFIETKIIKNSRGGFVSPTVSKFLIFIVGILFVIFTFWTPKIPLFCDPLDSTYGYFKII